MDNNTIMMVSAGSVAVIVLGWWFFGSTNNTPKTKEQILKILEEQGYRVKEIDFEDGIYEAEAYQDGKEYEIKLDQTGKIIKIEKDD